MRSLQRAWRAASPPCPTSVAGSFPVRQARTGPSRRCIDLPFNLRCQQSGTARPRRLGKASRPHQSAWARRRSPVAEGCTGGALPASLSGPSHSITRRPTARSATATPARARQGSAVGRGAWSQIVASIQPPCTPTATLTCWMLQEPHRKVIGSAGVQVCVLLPRLEVHSRLAIVAWHHLTSGSAPPLTCSLVISSSRRMQQLRCRLCPLLRGKDVGEAAQAPERSRLDGSKRKFQVGGDL
jgi:hypothetical protein